ncbi:hypothetical protein [Streptomyces mirabilis]
MHRRLMLFFLRSISAWASREVRSTSTASATASGKADPVPSA